jgi:hypothetical protein
MWAKIFFWVVCALDCFTFHLGDKKILLNRLLDLCAVLGFELRASHLLGRCFYHLKPLHQLFFMLGIFKIWSCELFAWELALILLISASWVARIPCKILVSELERKQWRKGVVWPSQVFFWKYMACLC